MDFCQTGTSSIIFLLCRTLDFPRLDAGARANCGHPALAAPHRRPWGAGGRTLGAWAPFSVQLPPSLPQPFRGGTQLRGRGAAAATREAPRRQDGAGLRRTHRHPARGRGAGARRAQAPIRRRRWAVGRRRTRGTRRWWCGGGACAWRRLAAPGSTMMWFGGSIPAAIAAAKQRSSVFVVFVSGTVRYGPGRWGRAVPGAGPCPPPH